MGKFADKFLGILRIPEDDYDEYDDYEPDEFDEPRESIFNKKKPERVVEPEVKESFEEEAPKQSAFKPSRQTSKVVPINRSQRNMEVCVIKPSTVEDAREITDTLLTGRAVVLNLEGIHVDVAQRIIDFTSGSCYAINGNLQKISNYIFIITPESVEISGDFQDLLSGGFDVAAFK